MRIAVFGGTFDPPHYGHIKLAQFLIDHSHAEIVVFVPAYIPPHKYDMAISSFADRVAMLKLALGNNKKFIVSLIEEQEKRSPSYSYDTMESLARIYPNDELLFIIGYDSLLQLHTWKRAKEFLQRWRVLTYPRDDISNSNSYRLEEWWDEATCKLLYDSVIDARKLPISSTAVRNRLVKSASTNTLITKAVEQYIIEHNLYGTGHNRAVLN